MKETATKFAPRVETTQISPDEFLTTNELMVLLKIRHKQTIYNLIDQGMPAVSVGRNYRFIKQEVIEFLRRQPKRETEKSF